MMSVARSGATVRLSFVMLVPPVVSAMGSVAFMPESTTTPPLVFASPLWMCEIVIMVLAGKALRTISNFAVAAVILPVESFVVVSVTVDVPLPLASASAIGGFSFAGDRSAVKTKTVCGVGAAVVGATVGAAVV